MSSIGHHHHVGDPVSLPEHGSSCHPRVTKHAERAMPARPVIAPSQSGLGTPGQLLFTPAKGIPARGQPPREDEDEDEY